MGRDLLLCSGDKPLVELEGKTSSSGRACEEQCAIETRSADGSNLSAAGASCALGCMNEANCLEFSEISL